MKTEEVWKDIPGYEVRNVLEENVDEQYYLSDAQTQRILAHCERKVAEGCGFKPNFQDEGGYAEQ